MTADSNNTDNEDVKTILAGEEAIVYSVDVLATNEDVNVETVRFTLDANLKNVVASAKLYLGDDLVATATNSDVSDDANSTIEFNDIDGLDIPTSSKELKLALVTENIGFEKIGEAVTDVLVTKVEMEDAEGVNSTEDVVVADLDVTKAIEFNVVPVKVTVAVTKLLSNGSAEIKVYADAGDNTQAGSNSDPVVEVSAMTFSSLNTNSFKLYEDGESASASGSFATINNAAAWYIADQSPEFTNDITFVILPEGVVDNTYSLKLDKT
jgi:hypothetical protein